MIYINKKTKKVEFMQNAEKLASVKTFVKTYSLKEQQEILLWMFHMYANEKYGNFMWNMTELEREKALLEMDIDVTAYKDNEVFKRIDKDISTSFLSSEEFALRNLEQILKQQLSIMSNKFSTSSDILDATKSMNIIKPQIAEFKSLVELQRKGEKETDSRMYLFEEPDKDDYNVYV